MRTKIFLSTVASVALFGLVGCGGGSSSSSTTTSSEVNGVAVDDLILDGVVTVTDTDGKSIVSGRTSAVDGSYKLDIPYKGVVAVTVSCDENSTMLNPETSEKVECPADVVLHSATTLDGSDTPVSVNISPLTEVAYSRALAMGDGNLTSDVLDSARAQVALAFGIDPIATSPVTNDTYKGVMDAIHKVADSDESKSVMDITSELSEAFEDGVIDDSEAGIKDVVLAIKDSDITTPISENNGSMTLPEHPASLDELDRAKEFSKELRTQVNSVQTFVDEESVNIDEAFTNIAINVEYIETISDDIANLISDMDDNNLTKLSDIHLSKTRTISIEKTGSGKFAYIIKEDGTEWSGDISFPEVLVGDSSEEEIYKTQTLSVNIDGDLPLDEENSKDTQKVNLSVVSKFTATKGAEVTIKGKIDTKGDVLEIKTAELEVSYIKGEVDEDGDVEPVFNYVKVTKLDLEGKAGGYTIDGTLDINGYVQNDNMKDDGGFVVQEHGGVSGKLSCESGADIDVKSISFDYNDKSYEPKDGYERDGDYYFIFEDVPANLEYNEWEKYIDYEASCDDGSKGINFKNYGSWGYDDEELNNSGWLPNKATFTGSIVSASDSLTGVLSLEWLNATTIDLDDENQEAEVKATLNGKLQMKDRPELSINLKLDTKANDLSADYSYDTTVVNLTAKETIEDGKTVRTYHVTNEIGNVLDIVEQEDGTVSGSLTKDGKELGSVENREDAPIIKYIDGSFETLF
jgi:hypothetical protein